MLFCPRSPLATLVLAAVAAVAMAPVAPTTALAAPPRLRLRRAPKDVRAYERLIKQRYHLNPGRSHWLLPGVGRLSHQVTRGADGRWKLARSGGQVDQHVASALGRSGVREVRASDPALPQATGDHRNGPEVIVPIMVPSKPGRDRVRNTLLDVERLLDDKTGINLARMRGDRSANWMHARTAVYSDGRGNPVLHKGAGLSHPMNVGTGRVRNVLAAIGGALKSTTAGRKLHKPVGQIKGVLGVAWTSVLGATNARDTKAEVERALQLHNTFEAAVSGRGRFDAKHGKHVARLSALAKKHNLRSTDLLPMPRAVIDMSHYPVVDGKNMGWVHESTVRPSGLSKIAGKLGHGQHGPLQVYVYEAPFVSRLLQSGARRSLGRALTGRASAGERAYWSRDLKALGLEIRSHGRLLLDGQPVTRENAATARATLRERVSARFEAVDLTLRLAQLKGVFTPKDASFGAVYDLHWATRSPGDRSIKQRIKAGGGTGLEQRSHKKSLARATAWIDQIR